MVAQGQSRITADISHGQAAVPNLPLTTIIFPGVNEPTVG